MSWRLTAAIARDQGEWLLFTLLSFALCMRGVTALITHPDQMALLSLFKEGLAPFNPGWFEKPPFHTYTNYFLAIGRLPTSRRRSICRTSIATC